MHLLEVHIWKFIMGLIFFERLLQIKLDKEKITDLKN